MRTKPKPREIKVGMKILMSSISYIT